MEGEGKGWLASWEKRDANARDDEIHHVEQGLAPQVDVEMNIWIRLLYQSKGKISKQ